MKIFLLILIFTFPLFAQKSEAELKSQVKTFKHNRQYIVKYDKFTDVTSVMYMGSILNSTFSYMASGTMIQIGVIYDSKPINGKTENQFTLYFRATGKNWAFLKDTSLYALADEKRFELGEGNRDSDIGRSISGMQTKELLTFPMTTELLSNLANAKSLEIKIGGKEFKVKDDDKEAFLNILKLPKSN